MGVRGRGTQCQPWREAFGLGASRGAGIATGTRLRECSRRPGSRVRSRCRRRAAGGSVRRGTATRRHRHAQKCAGGSGDAEVALRESAAEVGLSCRRDYDFIAGARPLRHPGALPSSSFSETWLQIRNRAGAPDVTLRDNSNSWGSVSPRRLPRPRLWVPIDHGSDSATSRTPKVRSANAICPHPA